MSKDFKDTFGEECDFTAEQQFRMFSKLIGLDKMGPIQISEMTKAFYAGFNQAFMLFTNEISNIENDEEAVDILDKIGAELNKFMDDQVKDYEKQRAEIEQKKRD